MTKTEFVVKPVVIAEKKYPPHRYQNIPQHPFTLGMVGTRGSGKTTILYNLLTDAYAKYFHRIVIMTPNLFQDDMYTKLYNDDWLNIADMHTAFDEDILTSVMDDQDRHKEMIDEIEAANKNLPKEEKLKVPKLPRVLIVIDDSGPDLRESIPFKKIHAIGRHKNISLITLVQKYTNLNTTSRANLNDLIITRPSTVKELKTISEDRAIPNLEKRILEVNERNAKNNTHDFIWLDRKDRLHINFTA